MEVKFSHFKRSLTWAPFWHRSRLIRNSVVPMTFYRVSLVVVKIAASYFVFCSEIAQKWVLNTWSFIYPQKKSRVEEGLGIVVAIPPGHLCQSNGLRAFLFKTSAQDQRSEVKRHPVEKALPGGSPEAWERNVARRVFQILKKLLQMLVKVHNSVRDSYCNK